eukprot:CAMPEP_0196133386 /NCGR_PEP_ID=MMETSP0910-20130528/2628_1 /TAXON_ID=49265 /ORGANISM="Thalassiosira rotula, Strain GSO102" /LENGTH=312 /DNA_ID=CAMNT_0041393109 /DNA_START=111 /DNA_END=1046 /DNA_ORIENTATION=+
MAFFGGLGKGGLQIKIRLTGTPESHPRDIFYLRHRPSWKVRKNVFTALKSHRINDAASASAAPTLAPGAPGQQQQQQQQQQQYGNQYQDGQPQQYYHDGGGEYGGNGNNNNNNGNNNNNNNPNVGKRIMVYSCHHDTEGEVTLQMPHGKKLDHMGIQVKFFGRIDMEAGAHEGRPHYDFISLSKELVPPGSLFDVRTIPFNFRGVEKIHESYHGRNVSVKYFVLVSVQRQWLPPITQEHEVLVQIPGIEPPINEPIKMEVGIEDCLHIEFQYEKRCYHLHDVIVGKINFLLVRIKIKHMELAVIRRETSGEG